MDTTYLSDTFGRTWAPFMVAGMSMVASFERIDLPAHWRKLNSTLPYLATREGVLRHAMVEIDPIPLYRTVKL